MKKSKSSPCDANTTNLIHSYRSTTPNQQRRLHQRWTGSSSLSSYSTEKRPCHSTLSPPTFSTPFPSQHSQHSHSHWTWLPSSSPSSKAPQSYHSLLHALTLLRASILHRVDLPWQVFHLGLCRMMQSVCLRMRRMGLWSRSLGSSQVCMSYDQYDSIELV